MAMLDVWCRHRVWRDGKFVWKPPKDGRLCGECLPHGYRCSLCGKRENLVPLPEDPSVLFCRPCLAKSPLPHMPEAGRPQRR
jgi:hypothetical protein